MMLLQPQVALIFTLATFLQLSLTIASTQECIQQGDGLPTLSMLSFSTNLIAQCPNFANNSTTIDCVIDFSDSSFASSCKSAGGEVYDYDYNITCPSSDSDGTRKITLNNHFVCAAKNCTTDDMKAIFEGRKDVVSVFGAGCSVEAYLVVSASAQECRQQSYVLLNPSDSSFSTSIEANSCKNAGGEVYDVEYTITCPSSDSDGTRIFSADSYFWCAAKVCRNDDVKASFGTSMGSDYASQFGSGCSVTVSVEIHPVVSAASLQECRQQSSALPTSSYSSFSTSMEAQCPGWTFDSTTDCIVDLSDSSFASRCKNAGGVVYDVDYNATCTSSDSDGTGKITATNNFWCAAVVCTTDVIKALFEEGSDELGDGCSATFSVETYSVVSGSTVIRASNTLLWALTASLLLRVSIL